MNFTQTYIKECLDYNPETGAFFWRVRPLTHFKDLRRQRIFNRCYAGKPCGHLSEERYLVIRFDGMLHKAHRLAWLYVYGELPNQWVDHINRNRSDNRIVNLRLASAELNAQNASVRSDNTSGIQGVSWHKASKKWVVQISKQGKPTHIGLFDSIKDAIAARAQAELARTENM